MPNFSWYLILLPETDMTLQSASCSQQREFMDWDPCLQKTKKFKKNFFLNDWGIFITSACVWFVKPGETLIEAVGWEMSNSPGLITSNWYVKWCSLRIAVKKTEWMRLSPRMIAPVAVNVNFCSVAHWGDWSVGKNCDWCLIRASQIPAEWELLHKEDL